MEGVLRVITRVLLWFSVATPVTWGALWALEHVMIGGVLGPDVMSIWISVAGIALALVAGAVVAYGFDRVLVRQRDREHSAASQSAVPSLPRRVTPPRRAR
jgi:4-hydroxybenzoate polyprenyltransferase